MVFGCVAVALFGVLDSVRPPRTGSGAQAPGRLFTPPVLGLDCLQALATVWGVRGTRAAVDGCIRLLSAKRVFARGAASEGPKILSTAFADCADRYA